MPDAPSGYNPYLRLPFSWDDSVDTPSIFDSVASFKGGQYSYAKPRLLNPDQSSLLEDCEEEITGQCSTRFGTAQIGANVGSGGTYVLALAFMNSPGNVYEVAIASGDTHIYKLNGGVWTSLGLNGFTDTGSIVQGINKIYFAGASDIKSWDGTSIVTLSGDGATQAPRNASVLRWHTNRLIASGPLIKSLSTDPNPVPDAVYFSNFLDPSTWGVTKDANQVRVGAGDGIPIVSLVPWAGFNIAVLKRHSCWVITADPQLAVADMPVQNVHTSVGCIARNSAVQVGSDIMFLADDGVRSLIQVVASDQQHALGVPISFPVQDIIERINWTAAGSACAAFWRNRYILAIPVDSSTTNNYVIVFNTITGAWTGKWTGLPITCFAIRELNGISRLMAGLANDIKVIEYLDYVHKVDWIDSTFQDYGGGTVQPHMKTRAFLFGDAVSNKLGLGGEIEWNNSKGGLTITPILDESIQTSFSINIPSNGFVVPFNPPFSIGVNGLGRNKFDLMKYGEFRELQLDILGTGTGRKELRQIALSGLVSPTLIGQS